MRRLADKNGELVDICWCASDKPVDGLFKKRKHTLIGERYTSNQTKAMILAKVVHQNNLTIGDAHPSSINRLILFDRVTRVHTLLPTCKLYGRIRNVLHSLEARGMAKRS